jgi:Sensors of blue-light using FAD
MGLQSLLYISESSIEPSFAQGEVERILATAHAFNPSVGVTGALVFTGTHFAQLIEGEETVVTLLIASIAIDQRHTRMQIVTREPLVARRFPDWSMSYNGPSQFVSRHVTRLLNDPSRLESSRSASWLAELLEIFTEFRAADA